jgi:hypothetical protein
MEQHGEQRIEKDEDDTIRRCVDSFLMSKQQNLRFANLRWRYAGEEVRDLFLSSPWFLDRPIVL